MHKLDLILALQSVTRDLEFMRTVRARVSGQSRVDENDEKTFERVMDEYRACKYEGTPIPHGVDIEKKNCVSAWAIEMNGNTSCELFEHKEMAESVADLMHENYSNVSHVVVIAENVELLKAGRARWKDEVYTYRTDKLPEDSAQDALDRISEKDKALLNLPDDADDLAKEKDN